MEGGRSRKGRREDDALKRSCNALESSRSVGTRKRSLPDAAIEVGLISGRLNVEVEVRGGVIVPLMKCALINLYMWQPTCGG